MDKLEKLNPGVQFTKELADMALAKSINAKMPRNLHEHTRTFLQGSKLRMARGIYSSNVQDYRRLHAESNEYWTMQGASGDDQDESVE
jgi:pyruvate dehydrogenase complex dehydrogenase (E1) component